MDDKEKLKEILTKDDIVKSINDNMDYLLKVIPEIKPMIGFDHKHPHHHLDVWNHTLEVVRHLNSKDFELNMAGLLHDIGKPFSYQEGEVRHFHGHPEMSAKMAKEILGRLNFDKNFSTNVIYLVKMHDTPIDLNNLDNSLDMIEKRLKLQYADAYSHSPKTVPKRIKLLNEIKVGLDKIKNNDRER